MTKGWFLAILQVINFRSCTFIIEHQCLGPFVGVLTVNDMRFNSFIEFMKMFISVIAQVLESLKTWKILALVKLNMGVVYILQRQLCLWSSTNYTTC